MRKFICSRLVLCQFVVEADDVEGALSKLSTDPDEIVEDADAIAIVGAWEVKREDLSNPAGLYDDDDVREAKARPNMAAVIGDL